jgi:xanthine dehydrogenase FAD-binding subunit
MSLLSSVDYVRPADVGQAVAALHEVEGARLIAGGTDLMIALRDGRVRPPRLVDIGAIRELLEIRVSGTDLVIGGAVRITELINEPRIRRDFPVLVDAGRLLGGWQIQNMATVAGNLCNASPAAELATPLLVLDAEVQTTGPRGARNIPLDTFWKGPGKTVLERGEIVTAIRIPGNVVARGSAYRRVDIRHSVDIAIVSASARVELDGGRARIVRLALGAVAPTPFRLRSAEELLANQIISADKLEQIRELARNAARPITDVRASAEYRRDMTGVLAARVLELALERAAR